MAAKKPDNSSADIDYANLPLSQQVQDLLARASLSQPQGARELGIDEPTMRCWYAGERDPPRMAILALERLVEMRRTVSEGAWPLTESKIDTLWYSKDEALWTRSLESYWEFVKPANMDVERELDKLDIELLRRFTAHEWYDFLHDKYFRWKYTAPNRLATTRKALEEYQRSDQLADLDAIRKELLSFDTTDVRKGLKVAMQIEGLGVAGASGLLSLMYPTHFATVDQFVVKALRRVRALPQSEALEKMNPESLGIENGMTLTAILTEKAAANNVQFGTGTWTPRKIDMVLWAYGH